MPESPEHHKFYKKPTSHEEVWENIQKIKEVHGPEKKDRVIVKLGNPEKPHKFVYMIDTAGNKYVIALPIERYGRHYGIFKLEEKLLKRYGKGERIKYVLGGGSISTRGDDL